MKRTKITLAIPTGEKKANGKNKQDHIVLWNSDENPDLFRGGLAELVEVNGKQEMVSIKKPVEVNGKTYQNDAYPFVAFVNRWPDGKFRNFVVRKGGEKGKTICELAFLNSGENGEFASGFYKADGLVYTDTGKKSSTGKAILNVDAKNPANLRMTAEIRGGAKEEIYAGLWSKEKQAALDAKKAQ